MNAQPKPAPRAPKPRRPIARTLIRRKTTKRRRKNTCTSRGCNRVPTAGVLCLTHAKAKADEAWSAAVRTGECELAEWHAKLPLRCGQKIQGCHGISRGHLGTRYLIENGFSGCDAVNAWAFHHPADWDRALRFTLWGEEKYARLWDIADNFGRKGEHVDYGQVIARLGQKDEEA